VRIIRRFPNRSNVPKAISETKLHTCARNQTIGWWRWHAHNSINTVAWDGTYEIQLACIKFASSSRANRVGENVKYQASATAFAPHFWLVRHCSYKGQARIRLFLGRRYFVRTFLSVAAVSQPQVQKCTFHIFTKTDMFFLTSSHMLECAK